VEDREYTTIFLRELLIPDRHFWHSGQWENSRAMFISTGDIIHLQLMENSIAYTEDIRGPNLRGRWSRRDNWNDDILSREF